MRRLLPILLLGFLVASLLIYLFGDSGLLSYRALGEYREKLAENVDRLVSRNEALSADLESLRLSPERNALMARALGLYRPGDQVVKLEGLVIPKERYAVGDLLRLRKNRETRSIWFKALGLGVSAILSALAVFGFLFSRGKANGRQRG